MGIEHVYDSRSIEFAEQIRRDTDGYGVDIVLNSVTGAAQRAGLELLSFGGRFVEIGKRDIYADTRLGLFPFRRNLTFYDVDLALMSQSHPQRVGDLLSTVYRLVADGELPVPESTHYPLADAATAIRVMSAAEHTGKLVLDVPRAGHSSVVVPPEQARAFRRDGAYIVTGGLGGLGLFLAEKMAAAGCGRIVLTSRSQPNPKALETIELIRAMRCRHRGGVRRHRRSRHGAAVGGRGDRHRTSVARRAACRGGGRGRHAGQHHRRAHRPRLGSKGLRRVEPAPGHRRPAAGLVLLVLLGGRSGGLARAGRVRRGQQLAGRLHAVAPGSGPAGHRDRLGVLGRDRACRRTPAETGEDLALGSDGEGTAIAHWRDTAFKADEGAYAFEALLRHDRAYTGYAPMTGTPWFTASRNAARSPKCSDPGGQSATDTSKLLDELNALPPDEWPTRLRRMVSDQVSLILRRSIDPDRPLSEYGLDSLGNLELRTRIEAETGIRVTSNDITTIRGLAGLLCEKLASHGPARHRRDGSDIAMSAEPQVLD